MPCVFCGGTGKRDCPRCNKNGCRLCNNEGEVPCPDCRGTGDR